MAAPQSNQTAPNSIDEIKLPDSTNKNKAPWNYWFRETFEQKFSKKLDQILETGYVSMCIRFLMADTAA